MCGLCGYPHIQVSTLTGSTVLLSFIVTIVTTFMHYNYIIGNTPCTLKWASHKSGGLDVLWEMNKTPFQGFCRNITV